jgi:hypothetical protein
MTMVDVVTEGRAKWLEQLADRCAWGAREARTVVGSLEMVAEAEGAEKGYRFRAEELRYDARGGMTEAQAATWDQSRNGDGR